MSYLVKLANGNWIYRGKPVARIDHATIYAHPSAARNVLLKNPGAVLVPLSTVRDEWHAARKALD